MEWPAEFYRMRDGDGCPMCAEGRPAETPHGVRFFQGELSDGYLSRADIQRGYAVIVWRGRHVAEPTELTETEAHGFWRELLAAGQALEQHFGPVKMNYNLLGNSVPHLHVHVVPRYGDDPRPGWPFPFPDEPHAERDADELRADASALRRLVAPGGSDDAKGYAAADPRIAPYVRDLLHPEDAVLAEIRERCGRQGLPPIAVGPFDGRHLEVIARVAGARRIVEIGTLGGYSGVCLARALPADGALHTFEIDAHHATVAEESFRRAGVEALVRVHVGPALERLPAIEPESPFDLVFIDADKSGYPDYLAWATAHLRVGGTLVADNVFRRAAFPIANDDPRHEEGIRRFNADLAASPAFRTTMLPLEDGLAVAVRVADG